MKTKQGVHHSLILSKTRSTRNYILMNKQTRICVYQLVIFLHIVRIQTLEVDEGGLVTMYDRTQRTTVLPRRREIVDSDVIVHVSGGLAPTKQHVGINEGNWGGNQNRQLRLRV